MNHDKLRKRILIDAIKRESAKLPSTAFNGDDNYKEQYSHVIRYLKYGTLPDYVNPEWDVMEMVLNDFDECMEIYTDTASVDN